MNWLYFSSIILAIFALIFFIPIRLRVTGTLTELDCYLYGIRVYRKRDDEYYQAVKETTKKPPRILVFRAKYLKLINSIKFLENTVSIGGYDYDYGQGAIVFGYSNAVLANIKNFLMNYQIPFDYYTYFVGTFGIKYNSIFRIQLGKILYQFMKIRRV